MNIRSTVSDVSAYSPIEEPTLTYCLATRLIYYYISNSTTLTRTGVVLPVVGVDVLATGNGGNSRWVSQRYWQSTRVGKNADQVVASGAANVLVTLQTTDHDPFVAFDAATSRIIALTAGQYYATATLRWLAESSAAGDIYQAHIRKSGVVAMSAFMNPRSAGYRAISIAGPLVMAANDYIDLAVQQNSGANKTVVGLVAQTYLALHKIS